MIQFVRVPACLAGLLLLIFSIAPIDPAQAQNTGVSIKITGPGSSYAYVDMAPLGSGDPMEMYAGSDGVLTVGNPAADVTTTLQPGIYKIWIESAEKDKAKGGDYTGGWTYAYVGKSGKTNIDFDMTGRPPVYPSGFNVFQIGQLAKDKCLPVTYQRAINQLTAYIADLNKARSALESAINDYIRDGGASGLPEEQRTKLAGVLLAGGSPKELSDSINGIRKSLTAQPNPLDGLAQAYDQLARLAAEQSEYAGYIARLQPPPDCPKRIAMYNDSLKPINVGPKGSYGCDAKLKEEVASTLGGIGLGALGGGNRSFGLGGGGSSSRSNNPARSSGSSSNDPKVSPDPVQWKGYYDGPSGSGTGVNFGTNFTDKGVWASADIVKAPCQGTFQTAYVRDPETGQKAGPTDYVLTGLYADWKLTVHWTYDRWVNNQHVEHRQGGWQDGGRVILGTWIEPSDGKGIWNDLGWSTAVAGAKGMGFYFPIPYDSFATKPLDIVIHVTNPDTDPVWTVGLGFETAIVPQTAGDYGRAPRALPKAPSQKSPYEMVWKTPFAHDFRYTPALMPSPPPPPPPPPL